MTRLAMEAANKIGMRMLISGEVIREDCKSIGIRLPAEDIAAIIDEHLASLVEVAEQALVALQAADQNYTALLLEAELERVK